MERMILGGTVHKTPEDMCKIIKGSRDVDIMWQIITPLARNEWVCWVTSAKKIETRERRLSILVDKLSRGERRPCCFAGCIHRKNNGSRGEGVLI